MTEGHRCAHCEATLTTAAALTAGECGCRWRHHDVALNPETNRLFLAEYDRYQGRCEWTELAPVGRFSQPNPPDGAVLIVRVVDGKALPVVPLADGELYAVRPVA